MKAPPLLGSFILILTLCIISKVGVLEDVDEVDNKMRAICAKFPNVYFLQRNSIVIDGVRIIGTLISLDFSLKP